MDAYVARMICRVLGLMVDSAVAVEVVIEVVEGFDVVGLLKFGKKKDFLIDLFD